MQPDEQVETNSFQIKVNDPDLIQFFSAFVSPERLDKMYSVLEHRTRHITVVLEDIYQPHNASAVLRTCDCLGIQDVHIIENRNTYTVNPDVVLGSEKWLTLSKYNQEENNTVSTLRLLKARGYKLVATSPEDAAPLEDLNINEPLAVMMGTELEGLSKEALDLADERVRIPMYGFTQSYNISVSAALVLYSVMQKLRQSSTPWALPLADRNEVLLSWLRRSVKKSRELERAYRKRKTGH